VRRLSPRTAALAALLAALSTPAHDVPGSLPSRVEARAGRVEASIEIAPAYPSDFRKHLSNGLTNVIALHVALVPERGDQAAALFGREIDVLYDVWEETYGVVVRDAATPRGRQLVFATYPALSAFLAEVRAVDLGPLADLGAGRWVVQTRVEVNPVSKELLEKTREFIANPSAGARGGPSRSVLGAFASYLLKGADPGVDVHVFRSAPFTAREVASR
jgi:hypothetical protein